jgi:hypothetical protein
MTDGHDELARKRAERDHQREYARWLGESTMTEQEIALERARETWKLSHPGANQNRGPRGDSTHDG